MNTTIRSFSVLAAMGILGATCAQAQSSAQMAPDTPWPGRIAAAAPRNIDSGMQVKSPSGDLLGTVASIVPGNSRGDGYVVIANREGVAIPVPYSTASSMVRRDTLVLDKARFVNAPKVQQYQTEDGSSTVWEQKADSYWKRDRASYER